MHVHKCRINDGLITIIIFKTRQCRIMGCKKPLTSLSNLPYNIQLERIQSVTVTYNYGRNINLRNLSLMVVARTIFEPELFPALRLTQFNPLCVNVFASGKVVITGLKTLHTKKIIAEVYSVLSSSKC